MNHWHKLVVLALTLLSINVTTWLLITQNQRDGIYPVDADSISIPIFDTVIGSLCVLPFLLLVSFLPSASFVARLCSRGIGWAIAAFLLLLSFYAAVALFALSGVAYWASPHHYPIAVCYSVLLLALVMFLATDTRKLFSNLSFQGTAFGGP